MRSFRLGSERRCFHFLRVPGLKRGGGRTSVDQNNSPWNHFTKSRSKIFWQACLYLTGPAAGPTPRWSDDLVLGGQQGGGGRWGCGIGAWRRGFMGTTGLRGTETWKENCGKNVLYFSSWLTKRTRVLFWKLIIIVKHSNTAEEKRPLMWKNQQEVDFKNEQTSMSLVSHLSFSLAVFFKHATFMYATSMQVQCTCAGVMGSGGRGLVGGAGRDTSSWRVSEEGKRMFTGGSRTLLAITDKHGRLLQSVSCMHKKNPTERTLQNVYRTWQNV